MKKIIVFIAGVFTFVSSSPLSAQWVDPNGPFGTTLTSLAVSGSYLFAGTTIGGVYLSIDNGTSWTAVNSGLTTNYVTALAATTTTIFAGTNSNGVFISTNNGGTWNPASTGLPSKAIQVLTASSGTLFAGTGGGGVYLSTNNGNSWASASAGLTDLSVTAITARGSYLFAGTANGLVFFSTNNGTYWTSASTGLPVGAVTSLQVLGANTPPTNLMVGMYNAIYTTTNLGTSWTASTTGLPPSIGSTSFAVVGTNIFAGTYDGVFLSSNSGTSWNAVDTGLPVNPNIVGMAAIGTDVFAGTSTLGVFRSTNNGTNWSSPNTGYPANNSVNALYEFNNYLFVGSARGVYRSEDDGSDWTYVSSGLPTGNTDVTAFASIGTYLFAGMQSDGGGIYGDDVFVSTDNGTSWNPASAGIPANADVPAFATIGTNLFAAAVNGIFRSTDSGKSWTDVYSNLPSNASINITAVPINALAVIGTELFAGTTSVANGGKTVGGGVYLSKDSGASWSDVSSGLPTQPGPDDVNALAVIGTTLFAGTSASQPQESTGPVFISTNYGTTWTSASSGFPTNAYDGSLLADGKNLYAGATLGGILVSTNNGTSWTNAGSPPFSGIPLAANPAFLFSGYQSVWRLGMLINNHPEPARDTQSVLLKSTGTVSVTLSDDTVGLVAHRIDFVNTSNAAIVVDSAALTNRYDQFAIAQLFPGIPDTVLPNDTFSMIVVFGGDDTGGIYRDTVVLSVGDPTSFYIYLTGKSFDAAPSGISQNLPPSDNLLIYPNPFSQQSTVEFSSSEQGYAQVTVVNLLGSEVARLFSGELTAGRHGFTWSASGMTPGMYECIVRLNERVKRMPMMLTR